MKMREVHPKLLWLGALSITVLLATALRHSNEQGKRLNRA